MAQVTKSKNKIREDFLKTGKPLGGPYIKKKYRQLWLDTYSMVMDEISILTTFPKSPKVVDPENILAYNIACRNVWLAEENDKI